MKYLLFFVLIFLFISTTLFSQSLIDSLETQLINAKEKERANILASLVHEYRNIDPQKAIEYGEESLTMIDGLDSEMRKAVFFNDLGWAYNNQK